MFETDEQEYYRRLSGMKKSELLDEIRSLQSRLDGWQQEYEIRKREAAAGTKAEAMHSGASAGRWLLVTLALGIAYLIAYMYSPGLMRLIGLVTVIYAFYRTHNP